MPVALTKLQFLPPKQEIEAERCKRSLHTFIQTSWDVVEQAVPFVDNWHIGLLSEYLEALYNLEIQNLIINIPPGHAKSLLCSVFFPSWVWIKTPSARFFCGSHDVDLAVRDAVRSRRLIQSDWYQERFGQIYQMTGDQNVKSRYENDKTGHRVSVGVNAGWTGHRGNYLVWDDPLDKNKKDSDVERRKANEAVKSSMATRGDNPKEIRRLLIMQRLHEDDPTGHLVNEMAQDENFPQFEHLVLPAEYEPKRFFSTIGLEDPRKEPGELLFPQLFDAKVLRQQKALLGVMDTAGQLQQRPAPAGGAVYLRKWWDGQNRYDPADKSVYNRNVARWLFWDTAFKDAEQNDTTALAVFELTPDYHIMLRHAWWDRMQYPQLLRTIEDEARRWNYDEKLRNVVVEEKASGISVLQSLRQNTDPWIANIVKGYMPPGMLSKEERGRLASPWCDKGCVLLPIPSPEVPWLYDAEDMLFKFPNGRLKDFPDAFSMAILELENLLEAGHKFRNGIQNKRQ